ncbi:hypothetical protein NC652_016544 [Populus alba x Populus x berolinensis]|nr:hypothetical protein NC652_016544 [Populus alba x Populus x berolinensis]
MLSKLFCPIAHLSLSMSFMNPSLGFVRGVTL